MNSSSEKLTSAPDFDLGIPGFRYSDLFDAGRLAELASTFYAEVGEKEPVLHEALTRYIANGGDGFEKRAASKILTDSAPLLSDFIARMFGITREREQLEREILRQDPIWKYKFFVQRRAAKAFTPALLSALDHNEVCQALTQLRNIGFDETLASDDELGIAEIAARLLDAEEALTKEAALTLRDSETIKKLQSAFEKLKDKAFGKLFSQFVLELDATGELLQVKAAIRLLEAWSAAEFYKKEKRWKAFKTPHALDYQNLVHLIHPIEKNPNVMRGRDDEMRRRDGFKLTDDRGSMRDSLFEVDYCMICHERDKDGCSTGLHEKDGSVKRNPLGIKTEGCPLDEKISEMHLLKKQGDSIGSLALVTIDNPMCAGTGHRICNDCMKGCIFQKQEPVNIPLAETHTLTDVLKLPYGFEIYSLLTRWNPLNAQRPYALPYNGKNIMVVGLGPAGYTLAHFLLNEGFGVVGIDGLKIEPLDEGLTGGGGVRVPRAVREVGEIERELDERVLAGFGGVSEYGITVRWDKNFLTLMHLTLARRERFRFYGGVRFGGTLSIEDAWELGFDHIAVATGAGKPTLVSMKNNLIRGIRKASDFLMALQLTGAAKHDSMANLQVRLPAVVIGGGLTAIDTATELFAYYPVQVEKMLERFEALASEFGEEEVWKRFDAEERSVLEEYVAHGRAVREERSRAAREGEAPDFVPLARAWGGVSIVYRKRLQDSPAYRLNHEEVTKALEEGIHIVENVTPKAAIPDEFGALRALTFKRENGLTVEIPARTLCVAAGTSPNTIYEKEHGGTFQLDKKGFFSAHRALENPDGRIVLEPTPEGFF